MPGEEILVRIGVEAIVGPTVASLVSKVFQRSKQRRKCSTLYTMLLNSPDVLKDEVARLGVEEGCWTESFVNTFRKAQKITHIEHRTLTEELSKVTTSPDVIKELATGDVDDALVKAVRKTNRELLSLTLNK